MKIDRIYKIYRMRRMKINPVHLVNPVYFPRSLHVSLSRPERMKIGERCTIGCPRRRRASQPSRLIATKCLNNQASAGWTTYGTFFPRSRSRRNERHPETMKIDRIYKIYRMRRMKINPVHLVNPVYFPRSLHVSLSRPERMKIGERCTIGCPRRRRASQPSRLIATKCLNNQASAGWTTYGTFFPKSRSRRNERHPETMKIDRIYKIYRMRRMKINPVHLVNPVYFRRR